MKQRLLVAGPFGLMLVGILAASAWVVAAQVPAQFPPRGTGISAAEKLTLQADVDALAAKVAALKRQYPTGALGDRVADVEVYLDAVRRPLKYDERLWAPTGSTPAAHATRTLATGHQRADLLRDGGTPWMRESGVRGFYSRVDGSAQPYVLTMPDAYDPSAKRAYRLDVFLHGRDDTTLEQQFMTKSVTGYAQKPFAAGADRFMLQPYGRYSNANRFAGETDGLEAIESVARAYPVDRDRIVMAGFSMGGASAWQYGLHFADRWAVVQAGAGFTETADFLKKELIAQPQNQVQRRLWHMYDATDYALNAFNVKVLAYSGGNDAQKQAADMMATAMLEEELPLEHVIGPGTGHSYEPGARQRLQNRVDDFATRGRTAVPREVKFTTWMLRYNKMFWISVDGMEQQWERARVEARFDANQLSATTSNVTALHVTFEAGLAPFAPGVRPTLDIDDVHLTLPAVAANKSLNVGVVKVGGKWRVGTLPAGELRKRHGLQGPIDDAFMDGFVFVRPTGTALTSALGTWEQAQADYAESEWVHFFRGEPRVKNDTDVTDADIAAHHLVLFGDPSSNAIYKRIASRLPISWTAAGVRVGTNQFPATHAPVFVFPNPLNPSKYVVINSGFTFHDQSNNAMQSPKLPDWAVVDTTKPGNNYRYLPLAVESQGFFDERWKLMAPMAP